MARPISLLVGPSDAVDLWCNGRDSTCGEDLKTGIRQNAQVFKYVSGATLVVPEFRPPVPEAESLFLIPDFYEIP